MTTICATVVKRTQVQWSIVLQDKVPCSGMVVKRLDLCKHTVRVVGDGLAWEMLIGEENISTQVICANPDGVGGGSRVEIYASRFSGGMVGQEGWNLILSNRGERLHDGVPDTRGDVVGTNSPGDSIVIELYHRNLVNYKELYLELNVGRRKYSLSHLTTLLPF